MRLTTSGLFIAAVILFSILAPAQVTVDATGPVHEGWRNIKPGRGGGTGRKLPVLLAIEVEGTPFNAKNGRTLINFILTNSGKQQLAIPVASNPDDLKSAESFRQLSLFVVDKGDKRQAAAVQVGTDPRNQYVFLYGAQTVPSTLMALAPGESIRVRAEVALPRGSEGNHSTVFVARAMMSDKKIRTVDGERFMESEVVGTAASSDYTPQALFKSAE